MKISNSAQDGFIRAFDLFGERKESIGKLVLDKANDKVAFRRDWFEICKDKNKSFNKLVN